MWAQFYREAHSNITAQYTYKADKEVRLISRNRKSLKLWRSACRLLFASRDEA